MTKISALSDIGTSVASNDTFVLVDVSDPTTPNKKIQQQNLFLIPDGSAGTPGLRFLNDTDVGLFRPTTNTLVIATGGSERLRIDSSGRLGLGTSSPGVLLSLSSSNSTVYTSTGAAASPTSGTFCSVANSDTTSGASSLQSFTIGGASGTSVVYHGAIGGGSSGSGQYVIGRRTGTSSYAESLRIDSSGRVGIGTQTPGSILSVEGSSQIRHTYTGSVSPTAFGQFNSSGDSSINVFPSASLLFATNNTERARIDSSGRLLLGTSTARNTTNTIEGTSFSGSSLLFALNQNTNQSAYVQFFKSRGTSVGSFAAVSSGDTLGGLEFLGADGSSAVNAARITAEVDGTPGANDMPGRLVFSVTADGASSPTEAMRIKNSRIINIANTPTYADNAAAKAGGLVDGDVYRTSTGVLMIVYT
jgi:hypothetical protein